MPQSFQKDGNEGCRYSLCDLVGYEELGKGEAEQREGIGGKYLIVHFHQTPCRCVAILSPPLFYGNIHYFVEMPLTLPWQCKETAIESPWSMNLMAVLSLGMETTGRTPNISILKMRQLAGSASFHLLYRQQNGPEEEQFWLGSELKQSWLPAAFSLQLLDRPFPRTLHPIQAPPLRFQYSPWSPSTAPCKNPHKDRKWMHREQETKKRSVFQQVIK